MNIMQKLKNKVIEVLNSGKLNRAEQANLKFEYDTIPAYVPIPKIVSVGRIGYVRVGGSENLFYDSERNNLLVFDLKDCIEDDIIQYTHELAHKKLYHKLLRGKNMVVYWTKSNFSSSEFIIFRGLNVSELKGFHCLTTVGMLKNSIIAIDDSHESKFKYLEDGVLKSYKWKDSMGKFI